MIYPVPDPNNPNAFLPGYPCHDQSARFVETPIGVSVAGLPKTIYNNNAFDTDLDSLYYRWESPLEEFPWNSNSPQFAPFSPGYAYNNPLPDSTFHPLNIPASLNDQNGAIEFTNYIIGSFVTTLAVESWRGNHKISEIYRDIVMLNVPDTLSNSAPAVSVYAFPGTPTVTGTGPYYEVTAAIGDTIALIWTAKDGDSIPVIQQPQTIDFSAYGMLVDTVFDGSASTIPCAAPPCPYWVSDTAATGLFQSQDSLRIGFAWVPDSTHLGGAAQNNQWTFDHHFVLRFSDDQCPIPAYSYAYLTVHLLNPFHPRLNPIDPTSESPRSATNLIPLGTGDYQLISPLSGPLNLNITDMGGRIHYSTTVQESDDAVRIPQHLAKGVYILSLESLSEPGRQSTGKWINR